MTLSGVRDIILSNTRLGTSIFIGVRMTGPVRNQSFQHALTRARMRSSIGSWTGLGLRRLDLRSDLGFDLGLDLRVGLRSDPGADLGELRPWTGFQTGSMIRPSRSRSAFKVEPSSTFSSCAIGDDFPLKKYQILCLRSKKKVVRRGPY
jgi:hypothetical protein